MTTDYTTPTPAYFDDEIGPMTRFVRAVNDLTTALSDALRPTLEAVVEVIARLAHALGLDTKRGRRRMRKLIELDAHRRTVAARHTTPSSGWLMNRRSHRRHR